MGKVKKTISFILSILIVLSCIDIHAFATKIVQNDEYVALDNEWLTVEKLMNGNTYTEETSDKTYIRLSTISGKLNMPVKGEYCDISWSSDNDSVITADGTITKQSYLETDGGSITVALTATISYGDAKGQKTFCIIVPPKAPTDEEKKLVTDCNLLKSYLLSGYNNVYLNELNTNMSLPTIISNLPLASEAGNGSAVTWESSDTSLLSIGTQADDGYVSGTVNRPSYTEGNKAMTLKARVSQSDTVYRDLTFDITVKTMAPDDSESVAYIENWLTYELILDKNSQDNVKNDLNLPTGYSVPSEFGQKEYVISWASSDDNVITAVGKVIRPSEGTKQVTLTANIQYKGSSVGTKEFTVTVTAKEEGVLALKFDDFANASDILQANGESDINDSDSKKLSFLNSGAGGSIFTKNKIHLNDDLSFSTAFAFNINATEEFGNYGDGGFTFTLQSNDSTVYYSGTDDTNSLGVKGVKPSVSIEFDTKYYKSEGSGQGSKYNADKCLGVFANGNTNSLIQASNYSTPFPLELGTAGTVNYAWIEYDGTLKTLEIRISNSSTRPYKATYTLENIDLKKLIADDNNLSISEVQDLYAGFTGSAGNMSIEEDDILNWYFKNDSVPIDFDHYTYTDASVVSLTAAANGDVGDCTLSAAVSGNDGVPTAGLPVEFSASAGKLDSSLKNTDSNGKASVIMHTAESISGVKAKVVAKGGMTSSVAFNLALTSQYVVTFDAEQLTDTVILNGNSSLDNVITDLYLPTEGKTLYNDGGSEKKSTISWVSSKETYLTNSGKVTNPSPEEGEQTVTLTATIKLGEASTSKEFTIIIKTQDATAVNSDSKWLDSAILNGNSAIDNIKTNLNLPAMGQYGSSISWVSSDTAVVKTDGTVIYPTFAEGDKKAVLTATIVKGGVTLIKKIEITVKAISASDTEAVPADASWLEKAILNGNASLDSVTADLALPKVGPNGSTITWASSDGSTVSTEGKVTRPAYLAGDKSLILTALLTKGNQSFQKTIKVIVKKLDETDTEKFEEDVVWIEASKTLGGNLSQYSIYLDLSLPSKAPNGSYITWTSSETSAITNAGKVTRPEFNENNVPVTMTATILGFNNSKTKDIEYTVLSKPDLYPPKVIASDPVANSTEIDFRKRQITITFDEKIISGTSDKENYGITLQGDWNPPDITVGIDGDGKTLVITTSFFFHSGTQYTLNIPKEAITDMSGNKMAADYSLSFTSETIIHKDIVISSYTPTDGSKDNAADCGISFSLAYEDGSEIKESAKLRASGDFNGIWLKERDGNSVKIKRELSGNKVTISLEDGQKLKAGKVYILTIPENAVLDRFVNENRSKTVQFEVAGDDANPSVVSTYPADAQTSVNVNQEITISFSKDVRFTARGYIRLYDNNNNPVNFYEDRPNARQILLSPKAKLSPGTVYTLNLSYDCVEDSSSNYMTYDYSMSFTTGSNTLDINSISPLTTWDLHGSPIDTPVKIELSDKASLTEKAEGITVKDSSESSVELDAEMTGRTAILTPSSLLKAHESYTVTVPEGAFKSESGAVNDARVFRFITESKIYLDSYDCFTVGPSANWIVNKELSFKTDNLLKGTGHTIRSYSWNFGDGTVGSDKAPKHTYTAVGSYKVTLSIEDNYGFTYEFSQTVNIGSFDSDRASLSVSPNKYEKLYLSDNPKSGYVIYSVSLSYNGVLVPDEKIKCHLYKNGAMVKDLGTYTTGNGSKTYTDAAGFKSWDYGMAMVDFWYIGNNYLGTYELVFTYGDDDMGKSVRLPVTIVDDRPYPAMTVKLYFSDTDTYYEKHDKLCFELDGKIVEAEKKWVDENGDCYVIDSVPLGFHKLRLSPTGNAGLYYYSDISTEYHTSATCPIFLELKGKQPGINLITSNDGSNSDKYSYIRYFSGVDRPETEFTINGDWDNLDPGYYQYKVSGPDGDGDWGSFESPSISLDLPSLMKPRDKLYFRMVADGGIATDWVDAKVEMTAQPETGGTVVYNSETKSYDASAAFKLKEILGETPNIFDGIPFLEDNENLAELSEKMFTVTAFSVGGKSQYIKYDFPDELAEMISKGMKFPVQVSGKIVLKYNEDSSKWELYYGYITLKRDTTLKSSGEKKVTIPVVKVSVTGELKLSALLGASLVINESDEVDYKYGGVVYIAPELEGEVSTGVGRFDISCFADASINSQIHTTGYMSARATVDVGVKAKAWLIKKTLFKFSLVDEEWNNGGDPILLSLPGMINELSEAPPEVMSRDYLQRGSEWTAENTPAKTMALNPSECSQTETMKTNIFPDSEAQLVRHGGELWMVWLDDNPIRSSMNRTQLMYSVYKDGSWSAPAWIGTDVTADFGTSVASTDNGVLIAWENMSAELSDSAEAGDFAASSEISVTKSEFTSGIGSQPESITLTNDDKYDHSPKLAASSENALLIWTKSQELSGTCFDEKTPSPTDSLYYSYWNGQNWSTAAEIEGSLPTVVDSSLTMNSNGEGLLLYTLDGDINISTDDQELYARAWKDGSWADAEKLADTAKNPKALYVNGDWFITWNQNGGIKFKKGLTASAEASGFESGSDYEITAADGIVALVCTEIGDNNTKSLSTVFYDTSAGVWSGETALTDGGNAYVQSFSPAFSEDGTINVVYTQAEMVTEAIDGGEHQNPSNKVNLRKLNYTLKHNLAMDLDTGLKLGPELPLPGTTDTVSATVLNKGDFSEKATVYLYDGDPSDGGKLIAQASPDAPVPAHSSCQVNINWCVASDTVDNYKLYAVVKADNGITESDESDNTVSKTVSTADIEITDVECTNLANNNYIMRATVRYSGSKMFENVPLELTCGDKKLKTATIDKLYSGEETGVSLTFSSNGLTANESATFDMKLTVSPGDGDDSKPENNTYEFTAEPASIVIKNSNPAQGDTKVDVSKGISIKFNMYVTEGTAFNQITLKDGNLNEVQISKTLSNDSLTITPMSALNYDSEYTLTIPADAVGDSYGHVMKEDYVMSFSSTSSSPEVMFSYPGANMADLSVNAEIKMKYNQSVLKGPSFEKISLFADSKTVTATVTTKGEWLYISPVNDLEKGTVYSLIIPSGAVINKANELQREDYRLTFDTEGTKVINDGSNNHSNDNSGCTVTHQTLNDGSVAAVISVDSENIAKNESASTATATINVTSEVTNDDSIQISLTEAAENRLISDNMDLRIITGKGDIKIPATWFKSLHEKGRNSITLAVTPAKADGIVDGLVSDGLYNFTLTAGGQQITELGQSFTLSIPLDKSKIKKTKRVIARTYDKASGSWKPLGGAVNKESTTLTFRTSHFSSFAAFESSKSFKDVTSDWAKDYVETLASRSMINGTSDNTFNPDGNITRAEFTALIVRSLYTDISESKGAFMDVPADSWYSGTVETAYNLGLVTGSETDKFDPNANITREQLAVIAYRLYKYKNGTTEKSSENTFTDDKDISEYAKAAINFAQNTGVMQGNNDTFYPKRNTTRQEAAVVLYRLLAYMGEI